MKIDKLTLLLDLPDQWKYGLVPQFISLVTDTAKKIEYGITRSYSPGCSGYEVSIDGKIPLSTNPLIWSTKSGYLLQAGPKKGKKSYLRLDLNPEALTPAGMTHLADMLQYPFEIPLPLWRFANVSRLDIAVDLQGVSVGDWVWECKGRKAREVICRSGEVRTVYLGAKRASPIVVYNKAKQNPLAGMEGPLTRVECRAKTNSVASTLIDLANPFIRVRVFNTKKMGLPEPHRQALLATGHLHGWNGILQTFPLPTRKEREQQLVDSIAPWWSPQAVWATWVDCLTATLQDMLSDTHGMDEVVVAFCQATKMASNAPLVVA